MGNPHSDVADKILHVAPAGAPVDSSSGGALQRRIRGMAAIQARDAQVSVLGGGRTAGARQLAGGATWIQKKTSFQRPLGVANLELASRGRPLFGRSTIVHSHANPYVGRLSSSAAASILQVDYYGLTPVGPRATAWFLEAFDAICPVSRFCLSQLEEHVGVPKSTVTHILPNGVDTDEFSPGSLSGCDSETSELNVLFVGRICEQKGADIFADLARQSRRSGGGWRFRSVGPVGSFDTPATVSNQSYWRGMLEESGVEFVGQVSDATLVEELRAADVLVMPTRRVEMFGMAALEALSCGTPVLTNAHGGTREFVDDSCGAIVPSNEASDYFDVLLEMDDDRSRMGLLGHNARRRALDYSWASIARTAAEVYDAVR